MPDDSKKLTSAVGIPYIAPGGFRLLGLRISFEKVCFQPVSRVVSDAKKL